MISKIRLYKIIWFGHICLGILLAYKQQWLSLTLYIMLICGNYYLWKKANKEYLLDLEVISDNLEMILQKKEIGQKTMVEDTLKDKIISQIQRIEEMNRGCQVILKKEQESIKQLFAEIAHQLKTPLANMETYLTLLEDNNINKEEQKDYLYAVANSEEKIKFLVEKFILAARMENRMIQIHKRSVNLKETVAQAVFQVYKKAEKKKILIEIKEESNVEKIVYHDQNWICEAVYNVLDNSIKYSQEATNIFIILRNNEMFSEICVEDEGIGIMAEEESKIFQIYYRGNNVSTQEGYGMGLFITREIVKRHRGFMRVKRKKQGLAMSIFLPK